MLLLVSWPGGTLALTGLLVLLLAVQYVTLFLTGFIPFEGPGGLFVVFVLGFFHTIALLAIASVLSTWFFLVTGKVYPGAVVNAALVPGSLPLRR